MKSFDELKQLLLNSQHQREQAEVILSNLLQLRSAELDCFVIPYDDVVVTIQAAVELLKR